MKISRTHIIYLGIIFICLISTYAGLADYDFYWQSKLGGYIVSNGDFYGIRNLVWGNTGLSEYYDHEWLTNVIFYIFSLIPVYGVFILKIILSLLSGIIVCCFIANNTKYTELDDISTLAIYVLVFIYSTMLLKVKAYNISVLLMMWEIICLNNIKQYSSKYTFKTETIWNMIFLMVICLLWTNMHSGSVPLFFVIYLVYFVLNSKYMSKKMIPLFGVAAFITLVLNPYGYKMMLFNLQHNGDAIMKSIIVDWQPIDAKTSVGKVGVLVIFIAMLFALNVKDIRMNLFTIIMLFGTLYLSMESIRHLVYFIPFVILLIVRNQFNFRVKYANWLNVSAYLLSIITISVIIFNVVKLSYDNSNYVIDLMDDELKQILVETNVGNNEGLFTADCNVWNLGLQSFDIGAFPYVKERVMDGTVLLTGSDEQIEHIIEHYNLTKFLFSRTALSDVYTIDNSLCDYLEANYKYEKVYDSEFYVYFVESALIN